MTFSISREHLVIFGAAAAALLLGAAWLMSALEKRRGRRLHGFAEPALLGKLIAGYRPELRAPLDGFVLLGTAFVLIAIAGPRWGDRDFAGLRGSREILVLLDTSESMNAENPRPDRLTRARDKVTALLDAYPGDRFGLIAFSGAAALQCPLTKDQAYFRTVLQSVTTDTLTAEGTDIESAFIEAEKLFQDGPGRGRNATAKDRIILLISDGEAVHGDAVSAAGRIGNYGRVVVLGIGDPEGAEVSLPQWMQRSKDAPANIAPHWSVLDEEQLAAVALAGGGVYVRSTLGNEDIDVIGRELSLLEGYRGDNDPSLRMVNRYRWPLAAGMLCFVLEGMWLNLLPHVARARRERAPEKGGRHVPA